MAKELTNPTTNEHFQTFTKACLKWADLLSLHDWDFNFRHDLRKQDADEEGWILASTQTIFDNSRTLTITLNKDWGITSVTDETIERCARDEILHVLLCELMEHTKDTPQIRSIEHGVIHRIIYMIDKLKEALRK